VSDKNKVMVRIAGKDYTLIGIEADDYIQKIGHYVDKKMSEIMRYNNKLSTSMVAVLTSINVADEFFKAHEGEGTAKKELKHIQDEVERLKEENSRLSEEHASLAAKNTSLQLDLAKREAELGEVRNSISKNRK
jgi:cell division protein ZapA